MTPPTEGLQRIRRLAPLHEIYALLDRHVLAVPSRETDIGAAVGCIPASDITAARDAPAVATASRDGWAVGADMVADAGSYAPVSLLRGPLWVDCGDAMPPACDAVLPPDGVVAGEAIATVGPGEGTVPAGADAPSGKRLRQGGTRLRATDIAALNAAGIVRIAVRKPRVAIMAVGAGDGGHDTVSPLIASAIAQQGGVASCSSIARDELIHMLSRPDADAIVTIGGTGQGRNDATARKVAAAGELLVHGFGIRPGDTGGFGLAAMRPVLMLPGRLDSALAVWLLAGTRLMQRLTGAPYPAPGAPARLTRKIASPVGLADVVLVRVGPDGAEPLAAGTFSLRSMAIATGWVLVPPGSEGYPAGATVEVNPLP